MAILNITMPEGSSICNGKQVTFRAPCSSNGVTGIQISGVTYSLVDTGDKAISASSFVEGTMVSVIIDTENNKAYIQSGGGAEIPVTTGVPEDADIWIDPSEEANFITPDNIGAAKVDLSNVDPQVMAATIEAVVGSGVKIATGSYVGTGTCGIDNPNTLTFDFKPMLVVINKDAVEAIDLGTIMIRGQSGNPGFGYVSSSSNCLDLHLSWTDNGVSWYSKPDLGDSNAGDQLNSSGATYCYAAIG